MVSPVFLTHEQLAFVEHCQAEGKKFVDHPALRGSATAISHARVMIEKAVAMGLPEVGYLDLRLAVSAYDIDASLPEHLRQLRPLP